MTDISSFIRSHLLEPLKQYPTVIQDTLIEIITQKLQTLYEYTVRFPEIVSPSSNRLDILKTIAEQFLFTIREDADIEEQIAILDNILYVYKMRGSVDTIENMWKYYGGTLPKDVKVIIPSYTIFRYSMSKLSGTHKFIDGRSSYVELDTPAPENIPSGTLVYDIYSDNYKATLGILENTTRVLLTNIDNLNIGDILRIGDYYEGKIVSLYENKTPTMNRSGVYEIRLTNNTYPIPDLKEFLIKELVAAGNYIYFTNTLHMDVNQTDENSNYYRYSVNEHTLLQIQLDVLKARQGLMLSGYNPLSPNPKFSEEEINEMLRRGFTETDIERMTTPRDANDSLWSGRRSIFLELTRLINLPMIELNNYSPYKFLGISMTMFPDIEKIVYSINSNKSYDRIIESILYCTPSTSSYYMSRHLYNRNGELLESNYPGYFILGESLLGEAIK